MLEYILSSGKTVSKDALTKYAEKNNVSLEALLESNPDIKINQDLELEDPNKDLFQLGSGKTVTYDALNKYATKNNTTVEKLLEFNPKIKSLAKQEALPQVTEEDIKVREGIAVKRLQQRLGGLGWDFKPARIGGDYVTFMAPAEYEGQPDEERPQETFSFDKGILGGKHGFSTLSSFFGGTSVSEEAKAANAFIKEHSPRGEKQLGVDADIYAKVISNMGNIATPGNKKIKDLTAKELEDYQTNVFIRMYNDRGLQNNTLREIETQLATYSIEQVALLRDKYDFSKQDQVEVAHEELIKLLSEKEGELMEKSGEHKKLIKSINAAVISRFGHKQLPGTIINEKYVREGEKEIYPIISKIREIPLIGDAIADPLHGIGTGITQQKKGDVETRKIINAGIEQRRDINELNKLKKMLEEGEVIDKQFSEQIFEGEPGMRGGVYIGTIGDRIKILEKDIEKNITVLAEGLASSKEYQDKLDKLVPAKVFDKSLLNPQVTMDEFQRMLGTQAAQMVASIFVYPTFAQEAGGIAHAAIVVESAR